MDTAVENSNDAAYIATPFQRQIAKAEMSVDELNATVYGIATHETLADDIKHAAIGAILDTPKAARKTELYDAPIVTEMAVAGREDETFADLAEEFRSNQKPDDGQGQSDGPTR